MCVVNGKNITTNKHNISYERRKKKNHDKHEERIGTVIEEVYRERKGLHLTVACTASNGHERREYMYVYVHLKSPTDLDAVHECTKEQL